MPASLFPCIAKLSPGASALEHEEVSPVGRHLLYLSIVAVLFLAVAGSILHAGPVTAQEHDGSLSITAYACPATWDGDDYAACLADPLGGVSFTIAAVDQQNGVGGTTNQLGYLHVPLFAADLPGDIAVHITLPEGYERFEAACQSAPGIAAATRTTATGIVIDDLAEGAEVSCLWYVADEVTTLPDTGTGTAAAPSITCSPVLSLARSILARAGTWVSPRCSAGAGS